MYALIKGYTKYIIFAAQIICIRRKSYDKELPYPETRLVLNGLDIIPFIPLFHFILLKYLWICVY